MKPFSIDATSVDPILGAKDECESAKILIGEGLLDEAKKILFRVLAYNPQYAQAQKLLKQVEDLELKNIFDSSASPQKKQTTVEDISRLIESLDYDLGLNLDEDRKPGTREMFTPVTGLNSKELLDLAIAYVEMGCFSDALRELKKAEKKIRTEDSFLGETGLTIVSLIAQCLVRLGKAFEAKAFLGPILMEADLKHEDKALLYYEMGCVEQSLGSNQAAVDWFRKVVEIDSQFKDALYRYRLLHKKP